MNARELLNKYKNTNIFSLSIFITENRCPKEDVLNMCKDKYEKKINSFIKENDLKMEDVYFIDNLIEEKRKTVQLEKIHRDKDFRLKLENKFNNKLIYSLVDILQMYKINLERINKMKFEPLKDYLVFLPDVLKRNLIKYEIKNGNSLRRVGGICFINYYFNICEETVEWLSQFDNVYDIDRFEDLTLYNENKVIIIASSEDECLF